MFIQTETTPNPLTLKFIPGVDVMPRDTLFVTTPTQAKADSPLAFALFEADEGVTAVFLAVDFITVTKTENSDWNVLKPLLLTAMMEHFISGRPVVKQVAETDEAAEEEDELVRTIKELIDTRVRPAVAMDGGDIIYKSFKDGIVKLELHGACSGCPSSTATLKNGIENMLKHYVPEVIAVEAVA